MRCFLLMVCLLVTMSGFSAPSHPVHGIDLPLEGRYPAGRGTDQMIVVTPDSGRSTTGTNRYGAEAIVIRDVVVRVGDNNNEIPSDGYVISAHGEAATWMMEHLLPGTPVRLDRSEEGNFLRVDDSPEALVVALHYRLERLAKDPYFPSEAGGLVGRIAALESSLKSVHQNGNFRDLENYRNEVEALELMTWNNRLSRMPSPDGEVRGVWSRLPVYTEDEIIAYVEELDAAGVNVYFPEVIYGSQSLYHDPTGLYPMFPDFGDIDPLAILLRECHSRGIEVHAWVHCFFIGIKGNEREPALLADRYPEWLAQNRLGEKVSEVEEGFMYFSPSHPGVREAMINAYVALATDYDIDGFQFDYIRFSAPRGWHDQWDLSDTARGKALEDLGFDPMDITPYDNPVEWEAWMRWRENEITTFVGEAAAAVRAVRPGLVLTADVFPDLEAAITEKGQNWSEWAQRGYIDALIPMSYSRSSEQVARDIREMEEASPENFPLKIGLGPFMGLTDEEMILQIESVRREGSTGQVLFSWETMTPSLREVLGKGPWRNRTAPVWRP